VGAIASTDPFTAEVFAASPQLRVIARTGVGLDTIDVEAAREAGVTLVTTPGANHTACADHTLAMMLSLVRRIQENDFAVRNGEWDRAGRLSGGELTGARVGIVGFGRIGRAVARRLEGFDAEIRVVDPEIGDGSPYETVSLDEVMPWCDILTVHCPLTPATHGMIGARQLDAATPGLVLINTARGEIVDEDALADGLRSGKVAAAGLDVFAMEPPNGSALLSLPGVLLSPHIGGLSEQSMRLMLDQCIDGVLRVLTSEDEDRGEINDARTAE
jgi:phosphoglycerate dehydrogenase-like enzyme